MSGRTRALHKKHRARWREECKRVGHTFAARPSSLYDRPLSVYCTRCGQVWKIAKDDA